MNEKNIINTLHADIEFLTEEIAFARQAFRIARIAAGLAEMNGIDTKEIIAFCSKVMDNLLEKAENTYGMSESFKQEVTTA